MANWGSFSFDRNTTSPETRELIMQVNKELRLARMKCLCSVQVTRDMPELLMLEILKAREHLAPGWYCAITERGGPSYRRLSGYVSGVLGGMAMRVDPRVRDILVGIDQNEEIGIQPRQPATYHPGLPPDHKRWRAAREARAAEEQWAADEAKNEAIKVAEAASREEDERMFRMYIGEVPAEDDELVRRYAGEPRE